MSQYNPQLTKLIKQIISTIKLIRSSSTVSSLKKGDATALEMIQMINSSNNSLVFFRIWTTEKFEKYMSLSNSKRLLFWKGQQINNQLYNIVVNPKEKFFAELDPVVLEEFKNLYTDKPDAFDITPKPKSNIFVIGIIGIGIYLMTR